MMPIDYTPIAQMIEQKCKKRSELKITRIVRKRDGAFFWLSDELPFKDVIKWLEYHFDKKGIFFDRYGFDSDKGFFLHLSKKHSPFLKTLPKVPPKKRQKNS